MENKTIKSSNSFVQNWWSSLFVGLLFIIAGIWVLVTPVSSYVALAILFSISMLVSGIMEIYFAVTNRKEYTAWGWYLTGGILDLLIGAALLVFPVLSLLILPLLVGIWLAFRGIMAIGTAIELRSLRVSNWGWLFFLGLCTMIFSFLMIINPLIGALSVVVMTGFAFLTAGIFRLYFSFKLRDLQRPEPLSGTLRHAHEVVWIIFFTERQSCG